MNPADFIGMNIGFENIVLLQLEFDLQSHACNG